MRSSCRLSYSAEQCEATTSVLLSLREWKSVSRSEVPTLYNQNMHIGLFIPCYIDQFYPQVGLATLELLERQGLQVEYPQEQTCCGQPMANAGLHNDAKPLAEKPATAPEQKSATIQAKPADAEPAPARTAAPVEAKPSTPQQPEIRPTQEMPKVQGFE